MTTLRTERDEARAVIADIRMVLGMLAESGRHITLVETRRLVEERVELSPGVRL